MSSIYQRKNGIWYVQYLVNGRVTQKSLKTKDKRVAAQIQKTMDAQLTLGQLDLVKGKVPVKATFEKLLAIRAPSLRPSSFTRYKGLAANIIEFLSSISRAYMNDLTDTDVARFVTARREKGASNKTIFEELLILKYAVNMLVEHNHLLRSPVKRWPTIKVTAKKPNTIGGYSPDEVRRILAHFAGQPIHDYLMGLAYTGCRRSELWAITRGDVNIELRILRISSMKTGTSPTNQFRHIEIHEALLPIIQRRVEGLRQDQEVFPKQGKGLWLLRAVRKACRDLGIQYRRLHGLRHTFISTLLNVGAPLRIVMEMAGHSDFETTLRYSHVSQNDMRGKINQLNFEAAPPTPGMPHQPQTADPPPSTAPVTHPPPKMAAEPEPILVEGPRKQLPSVPEATQKRRPGRPKGSGKAIEKK